MDISEATGTLHFELEDPAAFGPVRFQVSYDELKSQGRVIRTVPSDQMKHSYMQKMGLDLEFSAEFELVNPNGPMDVNVEFQDREPLQTGDYFYMRMEQLDSNKAWSSPVWVN